MLDWLIVGGGIHGCYLTLYLLGRRGVPPDRLRMVDPHAAPLVLWDRFAANVGMTYLRSGGAHHLHYDPWSLATFARTRQGAPLARFIEPYGRPALALFRAHSESLFARCRLHHLRLVARAVGLVRLPGGWRVETDLGGVEARRVILAIGATENPLWPSWSRQVSADGIHHIFDPAFDRSALAGVSAVVVGGGITAAQTALALAAQNPGAVTLLMRHPPRIHDFDSDPSWIDPRRLAGFHGTQDYTARRAIITAARHRGSMPPDVAAALGQAVEAGAIIHQRGEVVAAAPQMGGVRLALADGDSLRADRVLLATGFDPARPGGPWLDAAIAAHGLPTAPDGYPIVDRTLAWAPGLHVSGPLAELEVGPAARNFVGARLAAERIAAGL